MALIALGIAGVAAVGWVGYKSREWLAKRQLKKEAMAGKGVEEKEMVGRTTIDMRVTGMIFTTTTPYEKIWLHLANNGSDLDEPGAYVSLPMKRMGGFRYVPEVSAGEVVLGFIKSTDTMHSSVHDKDGARLAGTISLEYIVVSALEPPLSS